MDALNTCSDCHTSDATLVAIEQQFSLSPHGFGNFEVRGPSYAGGSCVACHTSQGFVANAAGETADFTGGAASMNCRTCHQIHMTYEGQDFALTTTDPVTLIVTGNTYDASATDVPGSNMCASCHQARSEDTYPAYDAPVTQEFEIPSSHYDFHHGPQTNVFTANFPASVMYGVSGNSTYGPHESPACLGCHMGFGSEVGEAGATGVTPGGTLGHNFAPAGSICSDCHSDSEGLNHNGVREAVSNTIVNLAACLEAEGVVTIDPGDGHAFHAVIDDPATAAVNEGLHPEPFVAAYMMVAAIEEDGSWGAHNPNFVTSLLDEIGANLDLNSDNAACTYTSLF